MGVRRQSLSANGPHWVVRASLAAESGCLDVGLGRERAGRALLRRAARLLLVMGRRRPQRERLCGEALLRAPRGSAPGYQRAAAPVDRPDRRLIRAVNLITQCPLRDGYSGAGCDQSCEGCAEPPSVFLFLFLLALLLLPWRDSGSARPPSFAPLPARKAGKRN